MFRFLLIICALSVLAVAGCGGGGGMLDDTFVVPAKSAVAAGDSETLYLAEIADPGLANTPPTEIMAVTYDSTNDWFNLESVATLTGFYSTHIALTADGTTIYGIDNLSGSPTNRHMSRYNLNTNTLTDLGDTGIDGAVQLAFNPDGVLYAGSGSLDNLYTIDHTASPISTGVNNLGQIQRGHDNGTLDIAGADLAFDSDGDLFVLTGGANNNAGLYSVDLGTMVGTRLWQDTEAAQFTGLAVRFDGTGDLIASNRTDSSFAIFEAANSYLPVYKDMRNADGTQAYSHFFGDMTSLPAPACEPYVTDLLAGQNLNVGTVTVEHEDGQLVVTYEITDPDWCITETHLHVATSPDGIPQKNGNPIPGQFDYNDEHECVTSFTYYIDAEEGWCEEDYLYIAAHAVVRTVEPVGYDEEGNPIYGEETAWGFGPEFLGRNWATYIEWEVCCQ